MTEDETRAITDLLAEVHAIRWVVGLLLVNMLIEYEEPAAVAAMHLEEFHLQFENPRDQSGLGLVMATKVTEVVADLFDTALSAVLEFRKQA